MKTLALAIALALLSSCATPKLQTRVVTTVWTCAYCGDWDYVIEVDGGPDLVYTDSLYAIGDLIRVPK